MPSKPENSGANRSSGGSPPSTTASATTAHPQGNRPSRPRKSEIIINVYDLLPPGTLASVLWTLGSSLLHTGVYIKCLDREYAFGGHDREDMSGVYWTRPRTEPPGGTYRCEILQGFSFQNDEEIEQVVRETSKKFKGPSYNLLSNNCNHFTSYLCKELTGRAAPSWLNRAARVGVALPCVVPREWLAPPDYDTADGELVNNGAATDDLAEDDDERTSMLRRDYQRARSSFHESHTEREVGSNADDHDFDRPWDDEDTEQSTSLGSNTGTDLRGKGKRVMRDSDGRPLPTSERAPRPHR